MRQVLLLVDIQNDYFPEGKMELVAMQQASSNSALLLSMFRKRQLPVIHVRHISKRPGSTFFLPNTKGADIHESVAPQPGEIIVEKQFPNSFRDTALLSNLKAVTAEEVVICGAMTHMCIDATTRAAFDLGFRCIVIEDACATRDLEYKGTIVEARSVHAAFLAALASSYAAILSAKEYADAEKPT
jgi:nicotinamidase-related amidase